MVHVAALAQLGHVNVMLIASARAALAVRVEFQRKRGVMDASVQVLSNAVGHARVVLRAIVGARVGAGVVVCAPATNKHRPIDFFFYFAL
jgi:hypothetical protein